MLPLHHVRFQLLSPVRPIYDHLPCVLVDASQWPGRHRRRGCSHTFTDDGACVAIQNLGHDDGLLLGVRGQLQLEDLVPGGLALTVVIEVAARP